MPSETSFAKLSLYDNSTDKTEKFGSFRAALAGTDSTSNMNKIDALLKSHDDSITALGTQIQQVSDDADTHFGTIDADILALQKKNTEQDTAITNLQTKDTEQDTAISKKATTVTYTANIDTTWTGISAPYTKTVTVQGILATDNPIVDLVPGGAPTAQKRLRAKAWSYVSEITTANNSITLTCYDKKPTTLFTIQLKVVR